ncbi:UDP-galactose/UDP-glucose transporter 5B-like [Cucumis melo var. makuwa]|uniref:UDP-galactose/UDP-glucose transporter 5B-like n=1 Tax=Cucumis melo var. makuwa TaxID=1194695 RepID=A0A5D3DK52_CUCMM|nr:UDP-galactose/UDP-glucose transporter 5B-like [Cucumis melo var. makuwa]
MAEPTDKDNKLWKGLFAVAGIMTTLVTYGVLQEKIMRVPYGVNKDYFKHSLFLVFCNRITTSAVSAGVLLASKKTVDPVAPVYKYCLVSITNILTTTCQYEALKYVSFPVQTLAKCAKMIPVMVWGTIIMQKKYKGHDYLLALIVTLGCSIFVLYPASAEISPYDRGRESTVWGVSLMIGYLGLAIMGNGRKLQGKKDSKITRENISCLPLLGVGGEQGKSNMWKISMRENNLRTIPLTYIVIIFLLEFIGDGLILQGHLLPAIDFVYLHKDCFFDIAFLSTVATASQFFISYTIRTFGALTFATIMTTRQLVSIMLSCVWFSHPLSWEQWIGAVLVFGSIYARSFLRNATQKLPTSETPEDRSSSPINRSSSPVNRSSSPMKESP